MKLLIFTTDVELSEKNMAACQPIVNLAANAYARVLDVQQYKDIPRYPSLTTPQLVTHPTQVPTKLPSRSPTLQKETS